VSDSYDQVAAVCYRWRGGQPEFLLVMSSGRRWIFPKGHIDPGEEAWFGAEREAHEEAGVTGSIQHQPLTVFKHHKRDLKRTGSELKIAAFLLHVAQIVPSQEAHRNPTWFTPQQALSAVAEGREFLYAKEMQRVIEEAIREIETTPASERGETDTEAADFQATDSPPLADRLFISYARVDSAFVDWLADQLETHGHPIWLDRHDIQPGDVWDDRIDEGLRACKSMILVMTPAAMASDTVSSEWKFALDQGKPLIPLLFQDCDRHFRLVKLQYIDFRTDRNNALDELITWLAS